MKISYDDIIVASATKISTQAISIIRVSGEGTIGLINSLIDKELEPKNGFYLRKIIHEGHVIDECLFLVFIKNHSFTGEETVEINCHGGIFLVEKIIELVLSKGARLAAKGEFSQRAFLNGKIDLIQAESINNIIHSKNNLALKLNAKMLIDKNNKKLQDIKENFINNISILQTAIDYPEYDETQNTTSEIVLRDLLNIKKELVNIIDNSQKYNYINSGIKTLILGDTNVGKSSLLNSLINEDKAIVTDIEGTTRDIVEGTIRFKNFNLNLIDSAGLRKTSDVVELKGIEKTTKLIDEVNLILFVINKEKYDINLYNNIKEKEHIVVLNKADLLTETDIKTIKKSFNNLIIVSAKKNDINELKKELERRYDQEKILDEDVLILSNISHIELLKKVLESIDLIESNIIQGFDIDIIMIDLRNSLDIINNMLGIFDSNEEILDNIFRKYCLGK
ncbi:tRNA modification GTPase TrmE [Spiroplasma litorale]|uniref:tRNA modification GTPase MnmE n=1 Tax=Spiroplasma litorale TaxID=216942 RepID=A0A0K1W3H4_9MOLU|nr:tRNA uridine-5-carboxymethylaminomethyl(34) synthesis GTPase MnmE [Spiroplasma litorale]AKX34728.1 tRNA modification GTPase TrmE [Spiroplasma litorale]